MKSKWITYQEYQIFNVDISNLAQNRDALKAELEAITSVVMECPENSVLALVDIRHTDLSAAMVLVFRRYAWQLGDYIYRAAVVDNIFSHFKMIVLNSIARVGGQEIVLFNNEKRAKEWLIKNEPSK